MPAHSYVATRSDGKVIGKDIREIVRLMLEEGYSWFKAADQVGLKRQRAARALAKPHVRAYRLEQRNRLIEQLSMRVPHRLNTLMDSENAAAAVRATLALEELAQQGRRPFAHVDQNGGDRDSFRPAERIARPGRRAGDDRTRTAAAGTRRGRR